MNQDENHLDMSIIESSIPLLQSHLQNEIIIAAKSQTSEALVLVNNCFDSLFLLDSL